MPSQPRKPRQSKAKTNCKLSCCSVSDELKESIRQSVEEGRGKSMFASESAAFGPQCRCGVPRKPPGIMKHVNDDGLCIVHPDAPPQPWTRGAESHGSSTDNG